MRTKRKGGKEIHRKLHFLVAVEMLLCRKRLGEVLAALVARDR